MPRRCALALIRGYQLLLSPLFAGSCRYVPSCSEYAAEAIARFGVMRGSWLALGRLARCHPLGGHGLDPVPPGVGRTNLQRTALPDAAARRGAGRLVDHKTL